MPVRPSSDAEAEIVGLGTVRTWVCSIVVRAGTNVMPMTVIVMVRDVLVGIRRHLVDVPGGMNGKLNARDASPAKSAA
jgi:hypothetical protein